MKDFIKVATTSAKNKTLIYTVPVSFDIETNLSKSKEKNIIDL
jgi:hypothetical protein